MAKDDFKVKKGLVVGKGIVADSDVRANAFIGDGSQLTNLDYSNISSNLPNILDSGNVSALIDSADTHDSAAVLSQITSTVDGDYIELRRPAESVFNVVNSGSSAYLYSGDGFPTQTSDSPPLYLTRGKTYKFAVNASGHPFWIKTSATTGTGNQYNDGVTNNGAQVGNIIFTVPMDAPTVLYYICQYHGGMKNTIYIDKVVGVDSDAVQAQIDSNFANDITIDGAVTVNHTSTSDPSLSLISLDSGNQASPIISLDKLSGSPSNGDYLGQIKFRGKNSTNGTQLFAKITGKTSNVTNGAEEGLIEFNVSKAGSISPVKYRFTGDALKVLNGTDVTVESDGFFIADYNVNRSAVTIGKTGVIVDSDANIIIGGDSALTTASTYVQSVSAGSGIKSSGISGSTPTVTVDSGFVTGLFTGGDGISYSGGTIALDPTDSATFANITATNEIRINDSANGIEVAHLSGDPNLGLVIHSHAHATDGGIRFVIHDTADSDFLVINRTNGISFENRRVRNIADPVTDQDAATKAYVDAVAEGLHVHAPTRAATVGTLASITGVTSVAYDSGTAGVGSFLAITGSLDSIDGVALASADRLLIKNETNQAFNGIYVWDSATRITRALDFDTPAELAGGDFVFNQEGATNADAGFVQTETLSSIGDSAVIFVQFSGAGQIIAGYGLSKTGNTLDVDLAGTSGLEFSGNQLKIDVADNTLELTAAGIRIPQTNGGVAIEQLDFDGIGGNTAFSLANVRAVTNEKLTALTALEDATYKFYTIARGDSDTRALVDSDYVRLRADSDYIKTVTSFPSTNLDNRSVTVTAGKGLLNGGSVDLGSAVTLNIDSANIQSFTLDSGEVTNMIDSAYVRPLARAAIVAGTNITYDSATGVISGAASLTVKDEGSVLSTSATALNFVGPGVTASGSGAEKTITIEGSAPSFAVALNLLDSTGRAGTDIPSALGVGDPVFYDSDAGYWTGAKADSASTASHVIVEYSTSNSNFKIAQTGVFTLDSNSGSPTFLDNSYYYISDSSGVPTATQPTTGIFQALYYALDSDTIDINLGDPVEIGVGTTDVEQFPTVTGGATILTLTQSINTARTDVFKNGVLLRQGALQDYTINSPTQITMVDALDDSDLISVRSTVLGTTLNTATTVITGTTASTPNPSVLADNNTGLFSDAADTLSITAGGTEIVKATTSGLEIPGDISGDLKLTSGTGIPNNVSISDATTSIVFDLDSGNTGTLTFDDNSTLTIRNTQNLPAGTAFTILAKNTYVNSDRTLTLQVPTSNQLHFNSTNVVTVAKDGRIAIISGMVFDANEIVISSVSLDSSLTF